MSTCGLASITRRASTTGDRTVRTPATDPAARVEPSMIAASDVPASVRAAPTPASKSGESSIVRLGAVTASCDEPPAARIACPAR